MESTDLPLVRNITIEGNESISTSDLKNLMRTQEPGFLQFFSHPRYVRDWFRSDLATIEAYYHRAGFAAVKVISMREEDIIYNPETNSVDIRIFIEQGKRQYLRDLIINPPLGEDEAELRRILYLKPGEPYDPQGPGMDTYQILRYYQNRGHFVAGITSRSVLHETPAHSMADSMDVIFNVNPGPVAKLEAIQLQGNSLPPKLILREMTTKVGERLTLQDILESKQNLYDSGFFRSVNYQLEPGDHSVDGDEESMTLIWKLRQRKMGSVETGVGIGTVDGLRLLGGFKHRNILNRGERLGLDAKLSIKRDRDDQIGISYEKESLEYIFLHIARLKAFLTLNLFREKNFEQESGVISLETRGIRLSAARRSGRHTILKLREQFDFLYQRSLGEVVIDAAPRTLTRSLSFIVEHDSRNDFFSPDRGSLSVLSYELAGGLQGGDNSFHRLQWSHSRYRRTGGSILSTRLYLGGVVAYSKSAREPGPGVPADGVPFEERFYCGGSATVRGYDNHSLGPLLAPESGLIHTDLHGYDLPDYILGGRVLLVANFEWRTPLTLFSKDYFQTVFFFDAGNTWENIDDLKWSSSFPWQAGKRDDQNRVFYGVGVGFRYLTPLTVIRIDYGVPLQNIADNSGRWHISLGQIF